MISSPYCKGYNRIRDRARAFELLNMPPVMLACSQDQELFHRRGN